jgi:hypothetical protein
MRRARIAAAYAVLVAATIVVYLPVWNNDFIDSDDFIYLTSNPEVKNGFTWEGFQWAWRINGTAAFWMPLTWLSFQFDAHFFSRHTPEGEAILSPAAFHVHNLFWHCVNVSLLFALWRRLTGRDGLSFVVAALFAVHPLHVESVAWAAERKDVLFTCFGLLALLAYVSWVRKPSWFRYLAMLAAFFMSLASKPMLLTFPIVLLLLDYWPLGRMKPQTPPRSRREEARLLQGRLAWLMLEKAPVFLLAAVVAAVTLEGRDQHGTIVSLGTLSLSARLANALTGYGWYVLKTFCPTRLSAFYPHPYEHWSWARMLAGAAALLLISVLAWRRAKSSPWLLVGWLWFVITLLPVSGVSQGGQQAWADRFAYWPHIGLFVAIVWLAAELVEGRRLAALAARAAAVAVLLWFCVLTWKQVRVWRDIPTLWQAAVQSDPDNASAHEHLSQYYHGQRQDDKAEQHLMEALRIQKRRMGARPFAVNKETPRPSAPPPAR